jgi:putative transposase
MWTQADRDLYRDDGRRYPSDLTDAQWAPIASLLSSYDPLKVDLREMVNVCLYLEKAGCPWRYLPSDFGPWATERPWHDRFRADGIWSGVAALLARAVRRQRGRPAEPSTVILDPQSVVSGPQSGTLEIFRGKLPARVRRQVLAWAQANRAALAAEWNRVNPRFPIA